MSILQPAIDQPLLKAAARVLSQVPYDTFQSSMVLGGPPDYSPADTTLTKVAIAEAVLDYERSAILGLQSEIQSRYSSPLRTIQEWFVGVGTLIQEDVVVRAGVRLAFESRHHFPHRKLDPYQKWFSAVRQQLLSAQSNGSLNSSIDLDTATETLVATGIGLKEIAILREEWVGLADRFGRCVGLLLDGWFTSQREGDR